MTRDLTTTLEALRPEEDQLDEQWSRMTLASILATRVAPSRPRKYRAAGVAAGALGVALVGGGVATAAGLSPQSFVDAFRGWAVVSPESEPGRQAVDPADARRVATAAGPGDTVFTLVAASGRNGFTCVAALFETRASTDAALPNEFIDANGSSCAASPPADARFGDMGAVDVQRQPDVLGARDVRVLSIWAGPATRAVVRTPDGVEHPMLRFDGRFYGWFEGKGDATAPVVLVGYTADGAEVGRTRL